MRDYYAAQDFLEVETPALQISPGLDRHIRAFRTHYEGKLAPEGILDRQSFYLHTSPEFAMKKLLVAGVARQFQICPVFRNGEDSDRHSPEFRILEWYRADAPLSALIEDCLLVLRAACRAACRTEIHYQGKRCDPFAAPLIISAREAFRRYAGIDLAASLQDPLRPDRDQLAAAAKAAGVRVADTDSWEDVFVRVTLEKIDPHLGVERPAFFTDFPLPLASLARPKPEDPRFAERFEFFVCGLELANAFGELTDAETQRARFTEDQAQMRVLYGEDYPVDEDFLDALAHGMPESVGAALGFDRLCLLAAGAETLDQVLWLPVALA